MDPLFPKVLLVSSAKVKADDPSYLLVRTEFGDWPKDRLAQVCASDDLPGHGEFCGRIYQLGPADRRFGRLFRRLRGQVSGMVAVEAVAAAGDAPSGGLGSRWARAWRKRLGDWLIRSGLWEVLFRVRLSPALARFIAEFQPDLVYCQGYSLGFSTLPLLISRRFGCPICFQTTDDWPAYTYRGSPVGWLLRRRARQLVAASAVRMAFGEKMRKVFEARYQRPFLVTYHADRGERFPPPEDRGPAPTRTIVFTGSLGLRRHEALGDLLEALRSQDLADLALEVAVYTSGLPKDLPASLRSAPELRFLPLPAHDDLPAVLAGADILFLPESFSVDPGMVELSISTKCHLYMLSGRPVLVYGPPHCGTVEYAHREGWGAVVQARDPQALGQALRRLLVDGPFRADIARRAKSTSMKNHDAATQKAAFLAALNAIRNPGP